MKKQIFLFYTIFFSSFTIIAQERANTIGISSKFLTVDKINKYSIAILYERSVNQSFALENNAFFFKFIQSDGVSRIVESRYYLQTEGKYYFSNYKIKPFASAGILFTYNTLHLDGGIGGSTFATYPIANVLKPWLATHIGIQWNINKKFLAQMKFGGAVTKYAKIIDADFTLGYQF
jgi:hypothetical protein